MGPVIEVGSKWTSSANKPYEVPKKYVAGTLTEIFLPLLKNFDLIEDESWRSDALCLIIREDRDWFSMGNNGMRRAVEVCNQCPVSCECLEYSIITNQWAGVWGGLTEQERKPLIKAYNEEKLREESAHTQALAA